MPATTSIIITGLNDAVARAANATSNIVNAESTNFQPKDIVTISRSFDGINLGVTSTAVQRPPGEGVDLAAEIVTLKVASHIYAANATALKIEQKTEKALLDIKT